MNKKIKLFSDVKIPPKGTVIEVNDFGKYDKYEISTGGLVFFKDIKGIKLLFLTRDDGKLTLPKGHVEGNEEIKSAALREICEETGLIYDKLIIINRLGWYPNPILVPTGEKYFKLVFYFLIEFQDKELPRLFTTEHRYADWYDIDRLKNLEFAYSHTYHVYKDAVELIVDSL